MRRLVIGFIPLIMLFASPAMADDQYPPSAEFGKPLIEVVTVQPNFTG